VINKQDSLTGREIAVIGMSGRFPGARNLKEFWSNLKNGVEAVRLLGDEELVAAGEDPRHLSDPHYVKAASMLDDVDLFDASFFGYNAREAEIMDPQQRLFLEHAFEALEDAGYSPTQFDGLIGVYAGVAWNTYLLSNLSTHLDLFEGGGAFQVFITNDKDFMPTRLSYKLNLKGPSLIIQTSCSTSLVAIHLACLSLLNYECDIALAGGVTVKVPQASGYFHQDGGLASPDGHCRAFDAKAAGTIFGSGIGVVTLKRLSEALEAGDPIRAVIRGTAINNDGSSKVSYTAPSVEGQAEVIAAAQAMAGVPAESIQYIETHGTGTSLGDPVEVTALTKAFRESTQKRAFCAIGSVKTNFGHLDAAAGVAGFIKTVLSLENRELPPSLNYEQPNPAIDFGKTPFYVNTGLKTWERNGSPRRAGVSSFGVGGTNAHVILEEALPAEQSGASRPYQLLLLSARTAPALEKTRENLLNYLQEHEHAPLADVAYTLQSGRTVFRQRLALVCKDRADAIQALQADSRRSLTAVDKEEPRDRPVVFMFSGQGSQYVNMTRGLYEHERTFREQFDICAKTLKSHLGCDLAKLVFPAGGDEQQAATQLEQTAFAQPALFAIEFSLAALWMKWGIMPRAMMGHSIGEYVAATLAGVMSLEDALALVAVRGRLMQQQPAGRMLAVLMPEAELLALLPEEIDLAAVNGPSSCVVSGPVESIDALQNELAAHAVDVRSLHTSHAFHSSMMDALLSPFLQEVKRISLHPPRIPYISNLTGTWIKAEQATDPDYWVQHLRQTVRFSQGLSELLQDRERIFLEVGPGRTLATLAARHPGRQEQLVLSSQRHPTEEIPDSAKVLETLGRLWMAGVTVDWQKFYGDENRRRLSLPSYPFERQRFWIDSIARSPIPRAAHSNSVRKNDIGGWFYLPSWRASLPPAITAEPQQTWMVLADSFGLGETMADHLGQQGRTTILVKIGGEFVRCNDHAYEIQPGNKAHFIQLFEELRDRKSLPHAIVHAWSLTHDGPHASEIPEFEDSQEAGFYSLLFLLQTLSQYSDSGFDLTVLSNHALSVGGECPCPEKALLLGLCSVAPQEFSHINCRFMDVDLQAHSVILSGSIYAPLAEQLVAEIDGRAPESVIALRGSQRWVRSFDPVSVEQASASPLRQGGTYLLSGGLTGNGFSIARYLASRWKANLIFLEAGASVIQPGVVSPELITSKLRLQKLESLGARVLLLNADMTNKHQLLNAWEAAESRLGEIHGVIHAEEPVGENTFRTISEAQREDFTLLFRPKVHALFTLESVLQTKKVDFCVLLSSLASVLGGIGYGGYTAANLFMDAFAHDRNRSGNVRWLSLNCDLWLGEDRRDEITKVRNDLIDLAMTEAEGEEAFSRALRPGAADQILVSTADLNARIADSKQRIENLRKRERESEHTNAPAVLHARPSLPTAYVSPETEMEKRIAAVWQRVLGFENVGLDDNFFDLGGDSLVAIQMAKQLKQELELDFPVAKLYQGVTIRALAQLLAQDEGQTRKQMAVELGELKQTAVERKEFQKRARARKQEARA
jgi:acyl transferase domain-containing protein